MIKRVFNPRELNHLRKYHLENLDLETVGESPVEYLSGHAEFYHLDFKVSRHTLIPRLESEKIIDLALSHINQFQLSHPVICDIGTGSGCLGITLAHKLISSNHYFTLYLSDISPDALDIARENVSNILPNPANVFFEQSDLFENYPKIKFDIVLANLPYIPSKNIATLDNSVKDFEPHLALDGGDSGAVYINKLLKSIPLFLSEKGLAILEIDDTHTPHSFTFPPELDNKIEEDLFGIPRFLVLHQKL